MAETRTLAEILEQAAKEERDLTGEQFSGGEASGLDLRGLGAEGCRFTGCRMAGVGWARGSLHRTEFTDCDLSGASFEDAGLKEVRFVRCKLVGIRFQAASLQQVCFEDCIGTYAGFADARLRDCAMTGGSFAEAVFSHTKLRKWNCATQLRQAEFVGTPLDGVDLTQCDIEGARFGLECLRGAQVTAQQAVGLAALLGVRVKE